MVRSILWQFVERYTNDQKIKMLHEAMTKGQPTLSELWTLLDQFLSAEGNIYCIIDGIDECIQAGEHVIKCALELLQKHSNLKIALLGQPLGFQNIPASISPISILTIEHCLVRKDISRFIRVKIDQSSLFQLAGAQDRIFDALHDNSDGMFLWVKLTLEELQRSSTISDIENRLEDLPRGLESAYQVMFDRLTKRLDRHELYLSQTIIAFVTVARRPLKVQELNYLLGLELKSREGDEGAYIKPYLLLDPAQKILHVCGSFVHISNDRVRLVHPSLRRFLTEPDTLTERHGLDPTPNHLVDINATHARVSSACFQYLCYGSRGYPMQYPEQLTALQSQHPLIEYASCNALYHLEHSKQDLSVIANTLNSVIQSMNFLSCAEHILITWSNDEAPLDLTKHFISGKLPKEIQDILVAATIRLQQELSFKQQVYGIYDGNKHYLHLALDVLTSLRTESCDLRSDQPSQGEIEMKYITTSLIIPDSNATQSPSESTQSTAKTNTKLRITKVKRHPQMSDMAGIDRIIRTLSGREILAPDKVITLLAVLSQSRWAKTMTDPLVMLFRFILSRAATFPLWGLIGVAWFYVRFDKFREGLEVLDATLPRLPNSTGDAAYVAYTLRGVALDRLDDLDSAVQMWQRALLCKRELFTQDSHSQWVRREIADYYNQQKRPIDCIAFFESLLQKDQKRHGHGHGVTAITETSLGFALYRAGQVERAWTVLETISTRPTSLLKKTRDHMCLSYFGESLWELGVSTMSRHILNELLILVIKSGGDQRHISRLALESELRIRIGISLFNSGKYSNAAECLMEAAKVQENCLPCSKTIDCDDCQFYHTELIRCVHDIQRHLGIVAMKQGEYAIAAPHFHSAARGMQSHYGPENNTTLEALENLVVNERKLRRFDVMLKFAEVLATTSETLNGANSYQTQRSRFHLADARALKSFTPEAVNLARDKQPASSFYNILEAAKELATANEFLYLADTPDTLRSGFLAWTNETR
jgi:tetratricopeptide (TPR) repeat protein